MIIIVFGLPGVGKTYLAKRLAKKIKGHHISSDAIRKSLDLKPTYSESEKLMIYKKMYDIMYDYVHRRNHLVLDGTFYKASLRENFITEMSQLGKEIKFIEVRADQETIKERLQSGKHPNSDADYEAYQRIEREFEPFNKDHLILYSKSNNIEELLDSAISYLKLEEKNFDHNQ